METTTIQIRKSVKRKLDALKAYPKESMDTVIERLTEMATDDEPLSSEEILDIERSIEDIKRGRTVALSDAKRKLGIK